MTPFDDFRRVYEKADKHRRSAWMIAQRTWSNIVLQGYNSPDAGVLRASPEEVLIGAKAYVQDLVNRQPEAPLTMNAQLLVEHRRRADRDDPYRFVIGAHRWLREGRWVDIELHLRAELAAEYDRIEERIQQKKDNVTRLPVAG